MTTRGTPLVISGARVFDERGEFSSRARVAIAEGVFVDGRSPAPANATSLNATGMWLVPGLYDCHSHISWGDFHREDRERRSMDERRSQASEALAATLRGGVTSVRDAGGADAALRDAVADGSLTGPRLQISVDLIGAEDAGSVSSVRAAVGRALDKGATWIKLVATTGVATAADAVLDSIFTKAEFVAAVDAAREGDAHVMVHTWGGDSIDWAIDAGATSLEHGIYLTTSQATRARDAGVTLVPTLTIYRYVRDLVIAGKLGGVPLARINDVIAVHEKAVRLAMEVGLPLAVGSDFTTTEQHGRNLVEIGSLMRAGLSSAEALLAATRNGAALLHDPDGGVIAPGYRADAVILARDPADPSTFEDPQNVAAVIKDGGIVHLSPSLTTT
ncbi:MAG: amidohydrolase family protein [Acidimicrobiales bacterium]